MTDPDPFETMKRRLEQACQGHTKPKPKSLRQCIGIGFKILGALILVVPACIYAELSLDQGQPAMPVILAFLVAAPLFWLGCKFDS